MFAALGGKPGGCKRHFQRCGHSCSPAAHGTAAAPPAPAPILPESASHRPAQLCFHRWTSREFGALTPPKNQTLNIPRSKHSLFIWLVNLSTASLVHPCSRYELCVDVKYKKNVKTSYVKQITAPWVCKTRFPGCVPNLHPKYFSGFKCSCRTTLLSPD